jgi:mannose-6-phosphate isomerase-like protein (cupin superfamily)
VSGLACHHRAEELLQMDVRSSENVKPVLEHNGSIPVWWLYEPREMKKDTMGGYLELISEFEVKPGGAVDPHSHHTFEFYYILGGRGVMMVGGEEREVGPGDLVKIPPNVVHSLRPVPSDGSIRSLAIAVGLKDTPEIDYSH